jgi:molybdopterin-binding protein
MDEVRPGLDDAFDVVAQVGQIGRQDGGAMRRECGVMVDGRSRRCTERGIGQACQNGIFEKVLAMKISARNVLPGTIVSIVRGPVTTEVTLEIAPGVQIVSTITSNSAESMQLKEGGKAYGVIKASSVMVGTD